MLRAPRSSLKTTLSAIRKRPHASLAPGDACRRLFLDVPAKGAKLDITVEARDRVHSAEILNALSEGGYQPVQIA
jgi:hypothetical protein